MRFGTLPIESVVSTTPPMFKQTRSEEHTSELQSRRDLVCRLLLEKKNLGQAAGVAVVVGQPLDVMAQGVERPSRDDACLAHPTAEDLAVAAGDRHEVGRADYCRAD